MQVNPQERTLPRTWLLCFASFSFCFSPYLHVGGYFYLYNSTVVNSLAVYDTVNDTVTKATRFFFVQVCLILFSPACQWSATGLGSSGYIFAIAEGDNGTIFISQCSADETQARYTAHTLTVVTMVFSLKRAFILYVLSSFRSILRLEGQGVWSSVGSFQGACIHTLWINDTLLYAGILTLVVCCVGHLHAC